MGHNTYLRKLFCIKSPYQGGDRNEEYFWKAMRETCSDFVEHSGEYREICRLYGFSPEQIHSVKDLERIPAIPTAYLKRNGDTVSVPYPRVIEVTSSGTSGKVSRVRYSFTEIFFCGIMSINMGLRHKLVSARPTHYIMLGYQPVRANKMVISKTAYLSSLFAFPISHTYALRYRKGSYHLDLGALIQRIEKLQNQRCPVRIIGFPSYLYFMLDIMQKRGISCRLPRGSKILLGGGWKQFQAREMSKERLCLMAERTLGIQKDQVHEFFGAAEHPVLYCTCPNHHFHIPDYAKVLIRDVRTLEPLERGKTGLINLITPLHFNIPIMSILTDDLGCIHPAEECGCGLKSDYLEILGRVGVQDVKTCSSGAQEYMQNGGHYDTGQE